MDVKPHSENLMTGHLEFDEDMSVRKLAKHVCYDIQVKKLSVLREFEVMVFYGQICALFLYIVMCKLFMCTKGSNID